MRSNSKSDGSSLLMKLNNFWLCLPLIKPSILAISLANFIFWAFFAALTLAALAKSDCADVNSWRALALILVLSVAIV